ncbi:MAG TPA: aminotransferase class IV [Acidimicrobiia bacterium]|nr:aminotransferase class IV [Acidimicrobiia bacterium]
MIVWLNGELAPVEQTRVSPLDHGLLVGDGVFETIRVYGGVPFAWTRHVTRLRESAAGLGLSVPDPTELRRAAAAVLDANDLAEARLRITVTGGPAPLGSPRGDTAPTVIVAASACATPLPTATVAVVDWRRNERGATAGLKTISYAENVRALGEAHARGADEAIFANTRDELCEATGSNLFVVVAGVVHTPPASAGCLLGVTRALVLELCEREQIPHEETDLGIDALTSCAEAFLSSTTREVQGIAAVDATPLAAPGPRTRRLADLFTELVARDPDP